MNKRSKKEEVKKRLMFVKGEDYYYLTYNVLFILHWLGCYHGTKIFKDYRKLAFLIDFISDYNLCSILENRNLKKQRSIVDEQLLTHTYTNGMIRQVQLAQLFFVLEKKNFIELIKSGSPNTVDLCLRKDGIPMNLFNSDIFKPETSNMIIINKAVSQICRVNLETLLKKLFDNYRIN